MRRCKRWVAAAVLSSMMSLMALVAFVKVITGLSLKKMQKKQLLDVLICFGCFCSMHPFSPWSNGFSFHSPPLGALQDRSLWSGSWDPPTISISSVFAAELWLDLSFMEFVDPPFHASDFGGIFLSLSQAMIFWTVATEWNLHSNRFDDTCDLMSHGLDFKQAAQSSPFVGFFWQLGLWVLFQLCQCILALILQFLHLTRFFETPMPFRHLLILEFLYWVSNSKSLQLSYAFLFIRLKVL